MSASSIPPVKFGLFEKKNKQGDPYLRQTQASHLHEKCCEMICHVSFYSSERSWAAESCL